jgi:hypothetical protein
MDQRRILVCLVLRLCSSISSCFMFDLRLDLMVNYESRAEEEAN